MKNVNIKNFRAFKEANFNNLGDINIIIGPNNTGKSSFLEAIILALSDSSEFYFLNADILKRNLLTLGRNYFPLYYLFYRRNIPYQYFLPKRFLLRWFSNKEPIKWGFYKKDESIFLEIKEKLNKFFFFKESNESSIFLNLEKRNKKFTIRRKYIDEEIILDKNKSIYSDEVIKIGNYIRLKSLTLYSSGETVPLGFFAESKNKESIFNKKLKQFTKYLFVGDYLLKCFTQRTSAGNKILFEVLSKFSENTALEALEKRLKNNFNIKNVFLKLEDLYIKTSDELELPLSLMGDGLYFFILYFYSLHLKNSSILFFEEPENFMHPLMLKIFSQEIIAQSKKHQIFITTHNKDLIDYLVGYASEDVDLKIFNFKNLRDGRLDYKVYSLEEAENLIYDLGVDLR